jgi:predicted RND superfamily exporter protein
LISVFVIATFALKLEIDASAETLLLEDDKDLAFAREIEKRYKGENFLVVTFTPKKELLANNTLALLQTLSDELEAVEGVSGITSILTVPLLNSPSQPISDLLENMPTLMSEQTDHTLAKKEFLTNPLYKENLVSKDFKTTALMVTLEHDSQYDALLEQRNQLLQKQRVGVITDEQMLALTKVQQAFKQHRDQSREKMHKTITDVRNVLESYHDKVKLHLGGVSMIADDMMTFVKNDLEVFSVVVFALLVIILYVLFQEVKWVLIPIVIASSAILVTSGLLGLFGWEITVISSNFIALQLIMTMSLIIHLTIKYKELRQTMQGASDQTLAVETVLSMAKPSFFVVITTIAGFSSLVVSGILPVINFGWMMSVGITISLILTFLFFPIAVIIFNRHKHVEHQDVTPFTANLATFADRYQKAVFISAVVIVLFSLSGSTRLIVENSFIDYFKENAEIYQGMKVIDQELGGTTPLDVIITFNEEKAEVTVDGEDEFADFADEFAEDSSDDTYWFTRAKIEKVRQVHTYLESLPEVGKVLSLATLDDVGKMINDGKYLDSFEFALLSQKLPPEHKKILLDPYVNVEANQLRITMRIIDSQEGLRRDALIKKITLNVDAMLNSEYETFKLSNLLVLYNNMLQSLFSSQISTLGMVIAILFGMFLILFRSIYVALVAMTANIVPVGVIFGFMGWMSIPLDMMTITIAAISIGIAVDNTIHYIHRFKLEYAKTSDYQQSMYNTHKSIGIAMFYTSLIIMIGFSVLVLSNFIPTIYFGLLTLLAMFMAIVADLILLPTLLLVFKPLRQKI